MGFEASREGQYDEKSFKWSIWWVNNKVRLRNYLTVFLGVIGFGLCSYGIYGFVDYYFLSGVTERAYLAEQTQPYINYAVHRERHNPKQLIFEKYAAVSGTTGAYDLASTVTNPNPEWVASFWYGYRVGGKDTKTQEVFILPGDTVWLDTLGIKSQVSPGVPELVTGPITWKRVDYHDTRPDYASWAKSRLSFEIRDAEYLPPTANDALTTSRARFTLDNQTAFSYHDIGLVVTLWSGTKLVGINRIVVSDVMAGERRIVEAVWFHEVPGVTQVSVKPVIDIFNERVYITPGQLN